MEEEEEEQEPRTLERSRSISGRHVLPPRRRTREPHGSLTASRLCMALGPNGASVRSFARTAPLKEAVGVNLLATIRDALKGMNSLTLPAKCLPFACCCGKTDKTRQTSFAPDAKPQVEAGGSLGARKGGGHCWVRAKLDIQARRVMCDVAGLNPGRRTTALNDLQ